MSYVVVNALSVPPGAGDTLEQRFAARAGLVEHAPGFERFELLRPVEGTDAYLVYTRWHSRDDYEQWRASRQFDQGHREGGPAGSAPAPVSTAAQIWAFEVAATAGG
jgi:heme-degrading monooxygenase HmoA